MAVVNELVTKFSFQGSLKPIKEFQENLRGSITTLTGYGIALGAATLATAAWANSTLRGAESLVRLSQDTDLSIKKLQEFEFIAAQNGVSSDSFANSIVSLNDKIGEAATQGSEDFNRLGISIRDSNGNIRSTESVLGDLTNKFQGLSQSQQINFANKLGIDKNLITAFNKTDEELAQLTKTAAGFGLVTEAQTKELDKYYASIESLQFGFTSVSRQVALQFAPSMQNLSNNITGFLSKFGVVFAEVFGEFFDGIGNLLSAFNTLISSTIGWKTALIAFGAALSIAFPVVAIVAGVGLILTAVEDLITAFSGGQSVIADFFKDTFNIDIVESLTNAFKILSVWLDIIADKFKAMLDFVKPVTNFVSDVLGSLFGDNTQQIQQLPNQNEIGTQQLPNQNEIGTQQLQPLTTSNINNTSTSNPITNNNNIKIEVKSNNPEAAGNAVNTALSRELGNASFQFGKGGK